MEASACRGIRRLCKSHIKLCLSAKVIYIYIYDMRTTTSVEEHTGSIIIIYKLLPNIAFGVGRSATKANRLRARLKGCRRIINGVGWIYWIERDDNNYFNTRICRAVKWSRFRRCANTNIQIYNHNMILIIIPICMYTHITLHSPLTLAFTTTHIHSWIIHCAQVHSFMAYRSANAQKWKCDHSMGFTHGTHINKCYQS